MLGTMGQNLDVSKASERILKLALPNHLVRLFAPAMASIQHWKPLF